MTFAAGAGSAVLIGIPALTLLGPVVGGIVTVGAGAYLGQRIGERMVADDEGDRS